MFRRSLTKANFPQNKTRQFLNLPFQAQEGEPLSGSSLKIRMEGKSLVCGFRKTWAVALSYLYVPVSKSFHFPVLCENKLVDAYLGVGSGFRWSRGAP